MERDRFQCARRASVAKRQRVTGASRGATIRVDGDAPECDELDYSTCERSVVSTTVAECATIVLVVADMQSSSPRAKRNASRRRTAVTSVHFNHPMPRSFFLLLATLAACTPKAPAEQYGFVALLGNDTVSIERITRTPRTLISDDVDRFPLVRQRHTVIGIADDGRLTRMVMDVRTPSGKTPAERGRRVLAEFTRRLGDCHHHRQRRCVRPGIQNRRRADGPARVDALQRDRTRNRIRTAPRPGRHACGRRQRLIPAVLSRSRRRPGFRAAQRLGASARRRFRGVAP